MALLQWFDQLQLAQSLQFSLWAFPIALTVHGIGMGVLLGVVCVINFRVMGLFSSLPLPRMGALLIVATVGFVVNFVSGVLLFLHDPVSYGTNPAFIIKLLTIVAGCVISVMMFRVPGLRAGASPEQAAAAEARPTLYRLAVLSFASWLAALVAGRLIAYVT